MKRHTLEAVAYIETRHEGCPTLSLDAERHTITSTRVYIDYYQNDRNLSKCNGHTLKREQIEREIQREVSHSKGGKTMRNKKDTSETLVYSAYGNRKLITANERERVACKGAL